MILTQGRPADCKPRRLPFVVHVNLFAAKQNVQSSIAEPRLFPCQFDELAS